MATSYEPCLCGDPYCRRCFPSPPEVTCDMVEGCTEPIAYIDVKGYVYCRKHGIERKDTCRCRQLKPKELKQILAGEPLAEY